MIMIPRLDNDGSFVPLPWAGEPPLPAPLSLRVRDVRDFLAAWCERGGRLVQPADDLFCCWLWYTRGNGITAGTRDDFDRVVSDWGGCVPVTISASGPPRPGWLGLAITGDPDAKPNPVDWPLPGPARDCWSGPSGNSINTWAVPLEPGRTCLDDASYLRLLELRVDWMAQRDGFAPADMIDLANWVARISRPMPRPGIDAPPPKTTLEAAAMIVRSRQVLGKWAAVRKGRELSTIEPATGDTPMLLAEMSLIDWTCRAMGGIDFTKPKRKRVRGFLEFLLTECCRCT